MTLSPEEYEHKRYVIAKDVLCATLSNPGFVPLPCDTRIKYAIGVADRLLLSLYGVTSKDNNEPTT